MNETRITDNALVIGYAWRATMTFPAGYLQAGETVEAHFRRADADYAFFPLTVGRDGDVLTLELDGADTAQMRVAEYHADLVLISGPERTPLNARLIVPAVTISTRTI